MSIRDGICPECGSTEIYIRSGWFNNIIVMFMPPKTQVHVCGNCGYVAEFIDKGLHLNHVKKNWQRLDKPEKPKNDQS
jgi:RNA polymerase subunit RPABC4/transcription elongation factor Spt4